MDLTNGHLEENQPKNKYNFELNKKEDFVKIEINELPLDIQEEIFEFMESVDNDDDESSETHLMEIEFDIFEFLELEDVPTEFIGNILKQSLVNERYEDADEIIKILNKKNYSVDITDNLLTLTSKTKKSE